MASPPLRVAVVGAGVFGCAIAFRLAEAGLRVTLIDRHPLGQNASGKNAGNLNPIFMSPPGLVPLALKSFRLHRLVAEKLRRLSAPPYMIEPAPRVLIAFDQAETNELDKVAEQFSDQEGFSARRLSGDEVRRCDARIHPQVKAGLLIEGNLSIDSLGFMRALISGAKRLGANFVSGKIEHVGTESRKVTAVFSDQQELACDAVCLCTGPWTDQIGNWFGISLSIKPVKGEMLRIKLPGAPLLFDFTHRATSIYRRGGETWLGTTHSDSGFDVAPTAEARCELLESARRIMPAIADAEVIEQIAALRPISASGEPVICRAEGWNNVFVANGGGNKGVLLSLGVAEAMCDLILPGATAPDLPPNESKDASFLR